MKNHQNPFTIGSWAFDRVPPGCETLEGHGFRYTTKGRTIWSAIAVEDSLGLEVTLEQYVDTQTRLLQNLFGNVQADPPKPKNVKGAEQGLEISLRLIIQDRNLLQRQIYARRGRAVGILTFTIDPGLPQPLPTTLQTFESSLQFLPAAG